MAARPKGLGPFAVAGNFGLDQAVFKGFQPMLDHYENKIAPTPRMNSSSSYPRHSNHWLRCIWHMGMGTSSQDSQQTT